MGKSPHSGGESRFFPDACSGIPERGTERRRRGPEGQIGKRERCRAGKRLYTLGRPPKSRGRWAEGTGHVLRPPAPGNDRDGQAEVSRQVCSRQQGPGTRDEKRLPGLRAQAARQTPGLRSAATSGRFCRAQDGRKPPQGRGFPFGRRTAAGYDGCRCVMEQAGGGGVPCFGGYPSEAGSFLRERR